MPRALPEIPNASMADIAFLLLTFFLVTTNVANDKGLLLFLPPPPEAQPKDQEVKIQERNLFKIQINSYDNVMVEGNPWTGDNRQLTDDIKTFILNGGVDKNSSDSPKEAIVSYKTDRGTTHKKFIDILDAIQAAYHEVYAERAGVTPEKWREIASEPDKDEEFRRLYDLGRDVGPDGKPNIPTNLSIAEPTKIGGK